MRGGRRRVVVRQFGRYTSEDIHRSILPRGAPASKKVAEFDEGVRRYMKKNMRAVDTNALVRLVTRDDRKQGIGNSARSRWAEVPLANL